MTIEMPNKTREEWRQAWLQYYQDYYTESDGTPIPVDVGPGSYPWARASAAATVLAMQSAAAQAIANGQLLDSLSGAELDTKFGARLPRSVSSKSTGYITIEAGSAGTTIQVGDTLTCGATSNQYQFTGSTPTAYLNGEQVPVESIDSGLGQDLPFGSVLSWNTPRAGCLATCAVWEDARGLGLSGARDAESDESYRARIRAFNANPAGSSNEGEIIALLEESSANEALGRPGHGIPVEKGFVYPAIRGPGTCGMAATIKQDYLYSPRWPSSSQLTTLLEYVSAYMPARDMLFIAEVAGEDTSVDVSVELSAASSQWADFSPWPSHRTRDSGMLVTASVVDALTFSIEADNADYSGVTGPSAGNTIAVFDAGTATFKRKTIATVSGTGPWDVTINSSPLYSDTSFIPATGKCVCPWFDDINYVAESIMRSVSMQGPGQMTSHEPGDGKRMIRMPVAAPRTWPSSINPLIISNLIGQVESLDSATLLGVSVPDATTGDTTTVYMLTIYDIGVFRE